MRVYPCLSIPTFPSHIDLGTQKVFQPDCGRVTGQSGERTRADKEETERSLRAWKPLELGSSCIGTGSERTSVSPKATHHLIWSAQSSEPWWGLRVVFGPHFMPGTGPRVPWVIERIK